ncbi:MAG: hypothetical protein IKM97_04870 [Clostridia bacterium]|nr:hypothetical protein [Clostridia bacterium]
MKKVKINGVEIQYNSKNVHIVNSYQVKYKDDMIIILRLFKLRTGYCSKRSLKSWIKEWKSHNRLYRLGLFKSHTKDCDLEENEKLHRLIAYQILGI